MDICGKAAYQHFLLVFTRHIFIDTPGNHPLTFALVPEIKLGDCSTQFLPVVFHKALEKSFAWNSMTNNVHCEQIFIIFFQILL